MTVAIVVALAVGAVVVSPPAVRLFDRKAGWPLAALLAAGEVTLASQLPGILSGEPLVFEFTWVPDALGSGADLDFALKADALGAFFALLALSIGTVVFVYSAAYLPRGEGNTSFYTIMTAFTLSIVLLVLANDVVVLFIAWELVSLASFMLIARSGSSGERGSMRTLVLTSKSTHCLNDLLFQTSIGNLPIEVPLVIANHDTPARYAEFHGVPFEHRPVTSA